MNSPIRGAGIRSGGTRARCARWRSPRTVEGSSAAAPTRRCGSGRSRIRTRRRRRPAARRRRWLPARRRPRPVAGPRPDAAADVLLVGAEHTDPDRRRVTQRGPGGRRTGKRTPTPGVVERHRHERAGREAHWQAVDEPGHDRDPGRWAAKTLRGARGARASLLTAISSSRTERRPCSALRARGDSTGHGGRAAAQTVTSSDGGTRVLQLANRGSWRYAGGRRGGGRPGPGAPCPRPPTGTRRLCCSRTCLAKP
jgi:hypothetical protein